MRVIAVNTLKVFWGVHPRCEQALKSWLQEVKLAQWSSPQDLKSVYTNASIITGKRVVFNINGNNFRLIVDIEFRLKIVVLFGMYETFLKNPNPRRRKMS